MLRMGDAGEASDPLIHRGDLRCYCEERISEADCTRREASSESMWHAADGACAALNGVLRHFDLLDGNPEGDH